MSEVDWQAEGLLDGLDDDAARESRRELLDQLHEAGVPLEDLREAVEEDRLALLPAERVLGGEGERHTRVEVAERTGLSEDFIRANWRALGLPDPGPDAAVFTEDDVEAAATLKQFLEAGLPEEGLIEVSRVLGAGLADAAQVIARMVGETFLEAGTTERDVGLRYAEAAKGLAPLLGPEMQYVLNLHLREIVRNEVVGRAEMSSGRLPGSEDVSVCFADLVGFTKLGERLPPEEIGTVANRLGDMAADIAERPVRLVKTIGDAAMLVSDDAPALVEAAIALVETADAEGEEFPQLRSGIARGPALSQRGDWYGRPVNLASRVTDLARPGSVLATREVRDSARDGFRWSAAGRKRVKGLEEPVRLYRARRPKPE